MKTELLVRFANEGVYRKNITINTNKIETPLLFPKEVFFTIDGVRVAVRREEWDELQKKIKKNEYSDRRIKSKIGDGRYDNDDRRSV
jgi:hypothetical protein